MKNRINQSVNSVNSEKGAVNKEDCCLKSKCDSIKYPLTNNNLASLRLGVSHWEKNFNQLRPSGAASKPQRAEDGGTVMFTMFVMS